MDELGAAHRDVVVVEQHCTAGGGVFHPVAAQRVANAGGGGAQHALEVVAQWVGAVEIDAAAGAIQPQAGQEPRQAEHVIPMHVGDEDAPQLAHPQFAAQELVLGAFTAVE